MVAPAKSGSEILVNTTTASDQDHASVAALKNGKFVVVWHDFNQPGSGGDTSFDAVRGQIFNADGSKMGAEFVLSGAAQTLGVQQDPVVVTLSDGRFVVAWESFNHQSGDPSGSCIDARIFNPDGTPATDEFLVNTHTDFWQTKPSLAALDTGGFVVTWMHDFVGGNQNYDIFARAFNASGAPVTVADFGVANGAEIESAPVVTGLPGNKYMIAWRDNGGPSLNDGSGSHIGAIIYTGDNHQTLNGFQFIVNSTVANDQYGPAIATLDNGNVIVTFSHDYSATDTDVRGRVFNANGSALALDFAIDANTAREWDSAVVAMPGGQYFVTWTDYGTSGETDGSGAHIRGAIMSGTSGTNVSGDFVINTTTAGEQRESAVTVLADGRLLAVWTDDGQNPGDTSGSAIRAQIFDPRVAGVTLNGTADGDDWIGTAFADTMKGLAGNDTFNGKGASDTLTGGTGGDTFVFDDVALTDAQSAIFDHITDYRQGNSGIYSAAESDRIDLSSILGAAFGGGKPVSSLVRLVEDAGLKFSLLQVDTDGAANGAGWTTIAQLDGVHASHTANVIVSSAAPAGVTVGVQTSIGNYVDFGGEGRADFLWRSDGGGLAIWNMNAGSVSSTNDLGIVASTWRIFGTGDFNGDGKGDIVWRNDGGALAIWQMDGGSVAAVHDLGSVTSTWDISGIGDFDGDGKSDLLWRDANGFTAIWQMNGGVVKAVSTHGTVDPAWHVIGVADVNGDAKSDVIWRHDDGLLVIWRMDGAAVTSVDALGVVGSDWHIVGSGDFNGDTKADMLWRNDAGA